MKGLSRLAFFFSLLLLSSFVSAYSFEVSTSGEPLSMPYSGEQVGLKGIVTPSISGGCKLICKWSVGSEGNSINGGEGIKNGVKFSFDYSVVASGSRGVRSFILNVECKRSTEGVFCVGSDYMSVTKNLGFSFGYCGDGEVDFGEEECDGVDYNGETCASKGFDDGSLSCSSCRLDISNCYKCGDGEINPGEKCDGSNLGGVSCSSLGFFGGLLGCTSSCQYDKTGCESEEDNCGDGVCGADETCSSCLVDCACGEEYNCVGGNCVNSGGREGNCGDGVCGADETCSSCLVDCGCDKGYSCIGGNCVDRDNGKLILIATVLGIAVSIGTLVGFGPKLHRWHKKRRKRKLKK